MGERVWTLLGILEHPELKKQFGTIERMRGMRSSLEKTTRFDDNDG